MKYFDDNGKLKSEIKRSVDLCFKESVDVNGIFEEEGYLLPVVKEEVYENWKRFPAESDIVAVYWASFIADKTQGDYDDAVLIHIVIFSGQT